MKCAILADGESLVEYQDGTQVQCRTSIEHNPLLPSSGRCSSCNFRLWVHGAGNLPDGQPGGKLVRKFAARPGLATSEKARPNRAICLPGRPCPPVRDRRSYVAHLHSV